jgi:hypothetical protein
LRVDTKTLLLMLMPFEAQASVCTTTHVVERTTRGADGGLQPAPEDRTAYFRARREAAKTRLAELEVRAAELEEMASELRVLKAPMCLYWMRV